MERITRSGASKLEHPQFDLSANDQDGDQHALHFRAARNETIAFQLILRRLGNSTSKQVAITPSDSFSGNMPYLTLYQAHYHHLKNAGYTWGPKTGVLPFPASYPDALVPQRHGCGATKTPLFDTIQLPSVGKNQSVWVEMYIPRDTPVKVLRGHLSITTPGSELKVPVTVDVIDAMLPDKTSFDAVGETYRSYRLEGAGDNRHSAQWQSMSRCYQRLAHQHRTVFIERTPDAPTSDEDWSQYQQTFGGALDGSLFSAESGYVGPGENTPVSIWRTPWPQEHDINVEAALDDQYIKKIETLARQWQVQRDNRQWNHSRFFAYLFDEVDGPDGRDESDPERQAYVSRVHQDMRRKQAAIDRGADDVDLLWTSHSDPGIWQGSPTTDLRGTIRLWAPNAHAANVPFLKQRIALGERAWFYHSGHPAVGGHSINLPGTDLRSWGVIAARYGFHGQLMWAVNLGSDALPFAEPSYKSADDRVGNGVLVYPGNQLSRIGFENVPGPLPSMRLKAWHRGLQDAELYLLARQRFPVEADALIEKLIPSALRNAVDDGLLTPAWPSEAAPWINWRRDLLTLLDRS